MGTILLFNIDDNQKKTAIRLIALRYGIRWLDVAQEQQNQTLEALLTGKSSAVTECNTPFQDEMMVMSELPNEAFHTLLDTLRIEGKSVRLKAIVTDHNRKWTALRLYQELIVEEAAMRKRK
jgi:hypothetical protein